MVALGQSGISNLYLTTGHGTPDRTMVVEPDRIPAVMVSGRVTKTDTNGLSY